MKRLTKSIVKAYKPFIGKQVAFNLEEPTFKQNVNFEKVPLEKYLGFLEMVAYRVCRYEDEKKRRYYDRIFKLRQVKFQKEAGKHEESSISALKRIENIGKPKKDVSPDKRIASMGRRRLTLKPSFAPKFHQKGLKRKAKRNKSKNEFRNMKKSAQFRSARTSQNPRRKFKKMKLRQKTSYASRQAELRNSLHHILGVTESKFNSKSVEVFYCREDMNKTNEKIINLKRFRARNKDMFRSLNNKSIMLSRLSTKVLEGPRNQKTLSTQENSQGNTSISERL